VTAIEVLLNGKTFIVGEPKQTNNGYDLGYVQVTLDENGKLTTSKELTISIDHGTTPEFEVTVGPADPDDGKLYWLINGDPMLDAAGNPVEAPKDGAKGEDAPTPVFHIWDGVLCYTFDQNPDLTDRSKNTWYELQNVIGPQGPVGPQGPSGLSITTDENGKVTITYDHDADPQTPAQTAELPTYNDFIELYNQVQDIQASINGISTLVGLITGGEDGTPQEFITDYRPLVDGNGIIIGFQFQTVKYVQNAEGSFEVVASGTKTVQGIGELISLEQDAADGKYYWVLPDGTKLPVKGEDGTDAAQPKFCIVNGHLWYTLDENPGEVGAAGHKWQDLGSVAALLKDGTTDTNKSLVTITRKPATDKNEVLAFTFGTGEDAVTIEVPTQGAFEELLARVAALETNSTNLQNMISAIDGRVKGLEGWLQGMKFVDSYELIKDQSGKLVKGFRVTFVTYEAVVDGNTVTYNKKAQTETVEYTDDGLLSLYYDETAGEWYWVFGQDNMIPVKAFKPIFQIHEGHIYASLKKESDLTDPYDYTKTDEWHDLGAVEPELGTTSQVLVGVTETDGYVNFTFKGKDGQETTLSLPKKDTFLALQEQVNTANNNITALQTLVNEIDTRLTTVEGDVTILKSYTHVTGYEADIDKNQIKGYTISFSNGKSIYLGNGLTPQIGIKQHTDGKFYWTVDGQFIQAETATGTTYVEAVGPKGEDAVTPLLKISDEGYWEISYDNGITFDELLVNDEPVKARGDKGDQGDSMFANPPIVEVDIDDDGTADKLIIKLADGQTQYEFPTWAAFEALKRKVDAINTTVKAFSDILDGTKFIQNITSFEDKNTDGVVIATGYELTYVEYTAAGLSAPKTERIYNGSVVGIKLDPSNNKYYWTINGTWLYDDNGNKVLAAGEQGQQGVPGPTPSFRIDGEGNLWVKIGDAQEQNLGKVLGETGKDGAVNITWDGKENTVNPVAAKDADYIYIQYGPATEDVIQVPTKKAFDALQARVGNLESDVTALKELVADNTFVQDINYMKDAEGKIIGFTATVAQYVLSNGKYTATPVKEITYRDDQITAVKEGNDWYWVIKDAEGNQIAKFKLTGSDFTPVIKYYNGHLYVSNDPRTTNIEDDLLSDERKNYWTDLGQITPSNGTDGVTLESVAEGTGEDAGYIVMTFVTGKDASGNKTYQTMKVPTKATFDALVTRVANLEANVDALETLVAESTFVKDITTKTAKDSNGYEYVNGFDAVMVKYQKVNGVWTEVSDGTYPKTITYTDDKITLVKNAETGAWEWKIKTNDADGPTTITLPASGGAPRFELFDGRIYVAIDPRATTPETDLANDSTKGYWRDLGLLNPGANVDGGAGNSLLSVDTQINENTKLEEVVFTFTDGSTIVVPTQRSFETLNTTVNQINETVAGINTLLSGKKFITAVTPNKGPQNESVILSYTISFSEGDPITIYNGTAGAKPVIGVTEVGGVMYWTVDGEFITDANGNRIQAAAANPVFKVENGKWYVSYQDGAEGTWNELGDATGESGDSWFDNVSVSEDGLHLVVKMSEKAGGETYSIPMWLELAITVNTNVSVTPGIVDIPFTIKGAFGNNMPEIATICEGDWRATVVTDNDNISANTIPGKIRVNVPHTSTGSTSGKVLMFVSFKGQTIMKTVNMTSSGVFVLEEGTYNRDFKSGSFTVVFHSDMFEESDYTIEIPSNASSWLSNVQTRATTRYEETMAVTVNDTGNPRSAIVQIVKSDNGQSVGEFIVSQTSATNLSASELANCYIIKSDGAYMFNTYKGTDGSTLFDGITDRTVEWKTNGALITPYDGSPDGKVMFEVDNWSQGNALLSVSGSNGIMWSWHLWMVNDLGTNSLGSYVMMDRNLGATSKTDEGAYYQYGRKDPFIVGEFTVSTSRPATGEDAAATPDVFYYSDAENVTGWAMSSETSWDSSSKSVTDPCPPGYMIPSTSVWDGVTLECNNINNAIFSGATYPVSGSIEYGDFTNTRVESGQWTSQTYYYGSIWNSGAPRYLYYELWRTGNGWIGYNYYIDQDVKTATDTAIGLNVRCVRK